MVTHLDEYVLDQCFAFAVHGFVPDSKKSEKQPITTRDEGHAFSFSANWGRHYYVAVCCFVVFNLADYAGKQLAVWIQLPGPSKIGQISLSTAAILRCALIPLFMFSNVSAGNRKTEIAFKSDAFYISFMVLLGFTNGYIGNIAMMFGPKCVKNNDHQVCTIKCT